MDAKGTPCCYAGNIGHEGDCVNSKDEALQNLVAQWRKQADHLSATMRVARASELRLCADELEKILRRKV